jgi:hypothetical protein
MEEVSLAGNRVLPNNLGGCCCACSGEVGDNLAVSDSPVPVCAVAADAVLTGFSC